MKLPQIKQFEKIVRIYAKQLVKSAKVFPYGVEQRRLFVRKPGDWLTVHSDDLNDAYIIQNSIFRLTYREI